MAALPHMHRMLFYCNSIVLHLLDCPELCDECAFTAVAAAPAVWALPCLLMQGADDQRSGFSDHCAPCTEVGNHHPAITLAMKYIKNIGASQPWLFPHPPRTSRRGYTARWGESTSDVHGKAHDGLTGLMLPYIKAAGAQQGCSRCTECSAGPRSALSSQNQRPGA